MRWANHINVRITMAPREGGQECLFHTLTPAMQGPKHSIDECKRENPSTYRSALQICKAEEAQLYNRNLTDGWVYDVCFAGTEYAAQDGIAESAM